MGLNRGGAAAEKATASKGKFLKTEYLNIKNGETITVRLLDDSDRWIWVKQHSFVDTKAAPADASDEERKNWPTKMGATCRRDKAFDYEGCYICDEVRDPKTGKPVFPSVRLWARAVVREEVRGTQEMADEGLIKPTKVGKVVGYVDAEVEVDETDKDGNATGNKVWIPRIILVNQGMKNFFSQLQGYYEGYDTVLDRDYRITRKGEGTDTTYQIVGCDPMEDHDLTDPKLKAVYEEYAAKVGLSEDDVEKMISERASDDYYARFFDPTQKAPPRKKKDEDKGSDESSEDAPAAAAPAEDEPPLNQDALEAMKQRVRGGGRKTAAS